MASQNELRRAITVQIVASLGQNQIPWRKPWRCSRNSGRPTSVTTGKPYQGINTLLLSLHAHRFGFQSKFWATFQQWESLGGKVKRRPEGVDPGAWGAKVVFYKPVQQTKVDETIGDEDHRDFFLMKSFCVFNAEQVEGQGADKFLVKEPQSDPASWTNFAPADELIAATGAEINYGGDRAFYSYPSPLEDFPHGHKDGDYIFVPCKERFESEADFYETVFHELGHWAEPRLGHKKESYAFDELVAELASCMVAHELGLPNGNDLSNHAKYVESWLQAMNNDPKFIFQASTQASRTTDFLLSFVRKDQLQPEQVEVA